MAASTLPAAPGGPDTGKLKPGIAGYLVGGALVGAALVIAGVLAFWAIFDFLGAFEDFDRVELDEATELDLEPGTYDVYLVGDGVDQATSFTASDLLITDPDGNQRAVVTRSDAPLQVGDETYAARLTFDAEVAGTYTFEAGPDADVSAELEELAIGPDAETLLEDRVPWFLAAVAVALVGGGLGAVVMIVTGVRRGKAKRAARRWMPGGPSGPAAPPSQPIEVVEGSWASTTPSVANQPVVPPPMPPAPAPAAPPADPWQAPGRGGGGSGWGAPPGSAG